MKLSDVRDVKSRGFEIVLHAQQYPQSSGVVLHIADRMGTLDSRSGYEKFVYLTKCNRIAEDWHVYSGTGYDEWEPREIVKAVKHPHYDFLLCRRCGSDADFEKAINEYWDFRDKQKEKRDLERQEELRLREAQLAAVRAEFDRFLYAYLTPDAPIAVENDYRVSYRVPDSGVVITIEGTWEDG